MSPQLAVKFYIRTLGCKMNLLDSARVATALARAGHEQVAREDQADLVLVNSCTVTAESDKKSRQAARSAERNGKKVVVIGCGPRVDPGRWQALLPQARVVPSDDELSCLLGIDTEQVDFVAAPRSRLPLPIQYGCDNVCAYCITRVARGPHRSEPLDVVVRHVQQAASLGINEVVLTGINLAAWGCSNTRRPGESRFAALLKTLVQDTSMARIRLSSLGPEYLDDAFFEALGEPRICDHLHLSVQSGSPSVLARMQRGYDVDRVRWAAQQARRVRPDVALTADFIVGLPGESEDDFEQTMALVRELSFAQLHVFPFSPRDGTAAATMRGQVGVEEKKRRAAALRALGRSLWGDFLHSQQGKRSLGLVDGDGSALTSNYIRMRSKGRRGELVPVVVGLEDVVGRRR